MIGIILGIVHKYTGVFEEMHFCYTSLHTKIFLLNWNGAFRKRVEENGEELFQFIYFRVLTCKITGVSFALNEYAMSSIFFMNRLVTWADIFSFAEWLDNMSLHLVILLPVSMACFSMPFRIANFLRSVLGGRNFLKNNRREEEKTPLFRTTY